MLCEWFGWFCASHTVDHGVPEISASGVGLAVCLVVGGLLIVKGRR